jgi:hypothetical protein
MPFYGNEAFLRELVLRGADIPLGEETGFRLGDAIRVLLEAAEIIEV